jgi:membrane-associated phospholipid phosphatase
MSLRISRFAVFALLTYTLAFADCVIDWNSAALDAIRLDRTPPPRAAYNLAILHVAIFDACNGITQNCGAYLVTDKPSGIASVNAAVAAAARRVLDRLYPAQVAAFENLYFNQLVAIAEGPAKSFGLDWGDSVAAAILQSRANDNSTLVVSYVPRTGPGAWQPTPPAFLPALLPNWPLVTPFAMTSGAQFRPPPPPALESAQWAADFNLTKTLGRVDSPVRTAEQTAIARFWADGAGSVTPPGHWNVIAREVAQQHALTVEQDARLFALLNLAEADAGIVAWDAKYAYNFWRPVTAIPAADTDGNPDTAPDATWTPLLVTPNFPEYVSGHSTFSGAGAAVLAAFFGTNAIAFTTTSEDLPGVSRNFASFSDAAREAGMSRIYAGIHFMSANVNGVAAGQALGAYVAQNFLPLRPGKSQRGH